MFSTWYIYTSKFTSKSPVAQLLNSFKIRMLHVDKATSPSDHIGTSEVCEGKKRGGGHETPFQRHT